MSQSLCQTIYRQVIAFIRKTVRRTARILVERLAPPSIKGTVYRRAIKLPAEIPSDFSFQLAETQTDLEAAFSILYDAYIEQGFIQPNESKMYLTLQHALPSTSTLVAKYRGEVVGTVTLISNNRLGLPLEKKFDISQLKRSYTRVAEVSSLAVRKDFRRDYGGIVFFPLLVYMYQYATRCFGLDYFAIAIYPQHGDFYQHVFAYEPLGKGEVKDYLGAPAVVYFLELRKFYTELARIYGHLEPGRNLFQYGQRDFPQFHFPERIYAKISDPVMTAEMLDYFFNRKTGLFAQAAPEALKKIARHYDLKQYGSVFSGLLTSQDHSEPQQRVDLRFEVQFNGRVLIGTLETSSGMNASQKAKRNVPFEALDVSRWGLKARLAGNIRFGLPVLAQLAIGEFQVAEVQVIPVWKDKDGLYGFRILQSCSLWDEFINNLHADQVKGTGTREAA